MVSKDRWNRIEVGDALITKSGKLQHVLDTYEIPPGSRGGRYSKTLKVKKVNGDDGVRYLNWNAGKEYKGVKKNRDIDN